METFSTPPFSPKVVKILSDCRIRTRQDLQAASPSVAFLLLKASGLRVTKSVFWQLVAFSLDKNAWQLSDEERVFWTKTLNNTPPVARFPSEETMQHFMREALFQAALAAKHNEVPVGAVVVRENQIIARAHNACVTHCDVSGHAEIQALRQAGQVLGNYRLESCDLYVSLEPCAMCASAIMQARVKRVIFAAREEKTGAAGSVINLFTNTQLNYHTACCGGILAEESARLLNDFFRLRRAQNENKINTMQPENNCGIEE